MARPPWGIALGGGGPLGAIYEIGALVALDEVLSGFDPTACDVYVGVSAGSFLAAGLANFLTPRTMQALFIGGENGGDCSFEPNFLLRPALAEYGKRLSSVVPLLAAALGRYLERPWSRSLFECLQPLGRALPNGVFESARVERYLATLFAAPGRTNDFRRLDCKLFVVATDLDSGQSVQFGTPGWQDVPISRAVQASAALPGLFSPVEINGRSYVDGALNKTLHASLALREGVKLLLCINPLVPFDTDLALAASERERGAIAGRGLPSILAQTFRVLLRSRMEVTMQRYRTEFPEADVVLFEPERDDREMFSANILSFGDRKRLCEHAYQRTRADLRRRWEELEPILARHGVGIDSAALMDRSRMLLSQTTEPEHRRAGRARQVTGLLNQTLDRLQSALDRLYITPELNKEGPSHGSISTK